MGAIAIGGRFAGGAAGGAEEEAAVWAEAMPVSNTVIVRSMALGFISRSSIGSRGMLAWETLLVPIRALVCVRRLD
jgi:hypothetical protein